jgi:hypothetical protein
MCIMNTAMMSSRKAALAPRTYDWRVTVKEIALVTGCVTKGKEEYRGLNKYIQSETKLRNIEHDVMLLSEHTVTRIASYVSAPNPQLSGQYMTVPPVLVPGSSADSSAAAVSSLLGYRVVSIKDIIDEDNYKRNPLFDEQMILEHILITGLAKIKTDYDDLRFPAGQFVVGGGPGHEYVKWFEAINVSFPLRRDAKYAEIPLSQLVGTVAFDATGGGGAAEWYNNDYLVVLRTVIEGYRGASLKQGTVNLVVSPIVTRAGVNTFTDMEDVQMAFYGGAYPSVLCHPVQFPIVDPTGYTAGGSLSFITDVMINNAGGQLDALEESSATIMTIKIPQLTADQRQFSRSVLSILGKMPSDMPTGLPGNFVFGDDASHNLLRGAFPTARFIENQGLLATLDNNDEKFSPITFEAPHRIVRKAIYIVPAAGVAGGTVPNTVPEFVIYSTDVLSYYL